MLRVISGKVRGLKLDTPKNEDVRPTTDRVKESLFNIINPYIIGLDCKLENYENKFLKKEILTKFEHSIKEISLN